MRKLPNGWVETPMDNLLTAIEAGRSFKCSERPAGPNEWGVIKVSAMTWREFDEAENKTVLSDRRVDPRFEIRSGDLLFSRANTVAYVGAVVQVGETRPRLLLSDKSLRLVPYRDVSPRWLLYYLRSQQARRYLESLATGTSDSMRNISQASLRRLTVPLAPLREQDRIVAAIEEQFSRLDAGVAALARTRKKLKRMRDALFQLTVPQESESWEAVTIEDSVRVVDYRGRTPPFSSDGIPHLRSFNVKDGRVKWDGCTWVTEDTYEKYMSRGLPSPGDLLFTTEAPMGEVASVPENKFCMAQRMMLLKPDLAIWQPEYLMYHLRSPWFQAGLRLNATGTTVQGISSRNFRPLSLYAPPLGIQEKLASRIRENLGAIQDLERALQAVDARGRQLRAAILASAFSGKLIDQNPADDPAAVLLERIASDRESSNGQKSARSRTPGTSWQRATV